MHAVKGTPFETPDQGKARLLTHWEQLDYGVQFTSSRKFFTISPIILYVLNIVRFCRYTHIFMQTLVFILMHISCMKGIISFIFMSETFFFFFAPQILSREFLHKIRHDTLRHKHGLAAERPDPQAAAATRRQTLRHQQVLSYCKFCCAS